MANSVKSILGKIGTIIAWPFVHISRVVAILTVSLKDYPAVRAAVIGLVQQVQANAQDIATAAADKGLNLTADEAELQAAIAMWNYIKTVFLPAIETAYNDDVNAEATAAATAAAAAAKRKAAAATTAAATSTASTSTTAE